MQFANNVIWKIHTKKRQHCWHAIRHSCHHWRNKAAHITVVPDTVFFLFFVYFESHEQHHLFKASWYEQVHCTSVWRLDVSIVRCSAIRVPHHCRNAC